MTANSTSIVNEALQLIGDDGPAVTGVWPNFDGSTNGNIAMTIYGPAVQAAMRAHNYDFARTVVTLALSGNVAPLGWAYEYIYPASAIQLWQVTPTFPLADPNDPLPTRWNVGTAVVNTAQTKVIWSDTQSAEAVINGGPPESTWDASFRAAVVRLLAAEFAMAGAGKPDVAQGYLESFSAFDALADRRSET